MPFQFSRSNDKVSGSWMVFFATAAALTASTGLVSSVVGLLVAGLLLAGLAALKSANDKAAAARVPVRVKVDRK